MADALADLGALEEGDQFVRRHIGPSEAEIAAMLVLPAIKEKLDALGTTTMISTPEQFSAMIKSEIALYLKVIKSANIRIE